MSDLMTFPETWEEFEQSYGFTDIDEVYTNGSRLIQSFRVKQWLEHMQTQTAQPEITDEQAIKHLQESGWMQAHDKQMYEMGLREQLADDSDSYDALLPSAQPERKKGEWVRNFDGNEWYWFCSNCKEEWYEEDLLMGGNDFPNFCPNCGADMRGEAND